MIYAIDFDGTLCERMYPKIGKPIQATIDFCIRHSDDTLILWTCRSGKLLDEAVVWCEKQGLKFNYVNENSPEIIAEFGSDTRKIYADFYIDDRNMLIGELEEREMITPKTREYRAFDFQLQDEMRATGKPVVFNSPTVLYAEGDVEYYEVIDARAFDNANMEDVVLNVDHGGKPAAKTKNGTLQLEIRDDGIYMNADLSKNATGRELYEDIKAGFFDKMSFAFTVSGEKYDRKTRTRTVTAIDRLFDVSAVTNPAYQSTTLSARSYFAAEAAREMAEAVEIETRKRKIIILALLGGTK